LVIERSLHYDARSEKLKKVVKFILVIRGFRVDKSQCKGLLYCEAV